MFSLKSTCVFLIFMARGAPHYLLLFLELHEPYAILSPLGSYIICLPSPKKKTQIESRTEGSSPYLSYIKNNRTNERNQLKGK